jgi:hypothetical protein
MDTPNYPVSVRWVALPCTFKLVMWIGLVVTKMGRGVGVFLLDCVVTSVIWWKLYYILNITANGLTCGLERFVIGGEYCSCSPQHMKLDLRNSFAWYGRWTAMHKLFLQTYVVTRSTFLVRLFRCSFISWYLLIIVWHGFECLNLFLFFMWHYFYFLTASCSLHLRMYVRGVDLTTTELAWELKSLWPWLHVLLIGSRRGMAETSGGASLVWRCNNVPLGRWCKGGSFGGIGNLRPIGDR